MGRSGRRAGSARPAGQMVFSGCTSSQGTAGRAASTAARRGARSPIPAMRREIALAPARPGGLPPTRIAARPAAACYR
jgi:hypothetical protein